MSKPRTYQTEAIIIKKTKLGEADSILTFYTPDMGKIQGFAKSLRKPKSKLAGHLELLTHSLVSLARGRNIDTITGSQTINSFLPLKTDLKLSSYALYATELVNQFTAEHIENNLLFQLLLDTLHQLCQVDDGDLVLRYFEINLLNMIGYRPHLHQCVNCHKTLDPVVNYFSTVAGGVLCPDCRYSQASVYPLSVNALKVFRLMQNSDYSTINRLKMNPELSRELKLIMRYYIRYLLERDLRSADWMDELTGEK